MHLLYNIGILFYGLAIKIASPFNSKAKLWLVGRKNIFSTLPIISNQQVYWFHCASLGEFDQALPVLNTLKEKNPDVFIVTTFFSPSGFLHCNKRIHKSDFICYLPLDTPSNAKKFIKHFNPEKIFFVKYEFWANYIFEAKKSGAKLYSISAIFRKNQRFFKEKDVFFKSILNQFDHFFVQNQMSANLLKSIGLDNYTVTGDTRFDRVIENKKQLIQNSTLKLFVKEEKVFIIGSSWPIDENLIIPLINDNTISKKVIIAPHDISENHIQEIIQKLNIPYVRFSELEKNRAFTSQRVLILDTIGFLANAYNYGSHAYIGGGFSGSLHNILEPGVFGLPVIFGPKHSRFPEAEMFINEGIGFSINSKEILIEKLETIENNLTLLKVKTEEFVKNQTGAAEKIINYLKS